MLKRIITAVVMMIVLLPFLIFSWWVEFLIPILVALMAVVGVWELFGCIGVRRDYVTTIPAYVIAVGLPLATYRLWMTSISSFLLLAGAVLTVYLLYLFTVAVFRRGRETFAEVATLFTGVTYITLAFSAFSLLRHQTHEGGYLYLLVFFGAWVTDTFAYFTGRFFGKHKLNPEISPKKTIEGSIGGIVFCMLAFVGFGLVMDFVPHWDREVNYFMLIAAGIICSLVSQIGDLITSLIKREHGVKDFGVIFPGHGGILDRFDSILAISPVLLILCNLGELWNALLILA